MKSEQTRINPTFEDGEIFKRIVRRIFRWDAAINKNSSPIDRRFNLIPTIKRACEDYMHFPPVT